MLHNCVLSELNIRNSVAEDVVSRAATKLGASESAVPTVTQTINRIEESDQKLQQMGGGSYRDSVTRTFHILLLVRLWQDFHVEMILRLT